MKIAGYITRLLTITQAEVAKIMVDPEQRKIEVLNQALKQAILQELR